MSLIDETYFAYEPVLINNLKQSNGFDSSLGQSRIAAVIRTIERYEPRYLRLLMGEEVYAEYVGSIDNPKWDVLKSKLVDSANKISPIANYVYFHYKKENAITSGENGDYVPKMDNQQSVSIGEKMILAWNDMVEQNKPILEWIYTNILVAENPSIETTATWDYSSWGVLTRKENGFL